MEDLLIGITKEIFFIYNEMAIYLMFGFLMAGVLYILFPSGVIRKHLGTKDIKAVVKSATLGVPLPLCSCGVIPTGISLYRQGAGRGATVSFLISTPQTGVESILVTYGFLGPIFALFRPLAAFISGIVGGAFTNLLVKDSNLSSSSSPSICTTCGELQIEGEHGHRLGEKVKKMLEYALVDFPSDIVKWLVISICIAGLISYLLPENFISVHLSSGIYAMLLMMVVGIPLYVCATGSIPIAAVLMVKGLSPGAALVFLMTGPATNSATITMLAKTLGIKTTIIYVATIASMSLVFGLGLDAVYNAWGLDTKAIATGTKMLPFWLKLGASISLGVVLAYALYRRYVLKVEPPTGEVKMVEKGLIVKIKGMTCQHCVASVQKAIGSLPGVASVKVSLQSSQATVTGSGLDTEAIRQKVTEAGYEVTEVKIQ